VQCRPASDKPRCLFRRAAPRSRTRRRRAAVALALCGTVLFSGMVAVPAYAAPTLEISLRQTTGSAPFDAADGAGRDSSPTDEVVRTNDTVTYTVGVHFGGEEDHAQPTIELTLPRGEELVRLPPFCLSGSDVTPATLPAPAMPLTLESHLALPRQTIRCRVADGHHR